MIITGGLLLIVLLYGVVEFAAWRDMKDTVTKKRLGRGVGGR